MRAIINGFNLDFQVDVLNRLVDLVDFNYIYHISSDGVSISSSSKSKMVVETKSFHVIGEGNYDSSDCPPLDSLVIEKMLPYEPTALKLMDRLELFSNGGYSKYQKRYDLYLKHLRYWDNIIKKKQINLYLSQNVPHEVYDYIIYALCKIYGIPVLFFFQTQIHDTTFLTSDISNWQEYLLPEYKSIQAQYADEKVEEIKFSDNVLREWSSRINKKKPFYMKKYWYGFKDSNTLFDTQRFGNKSRIKKILNPFKLFNFIYFLIKKSCQNKILMFFYRSVSSEPDYSKKYVYFPMHLQPESTTCPMGGAMGDQKLVIDIISHALPEDVFLYVKENPKQGYLCRNYDFYNDILKINKNIKFISLNSDTYKLTSNAIAVATVTGTAGWEALFAQKPVLVFGDYFYDCAPGVFRIRSLADCLAAMNIVISNAFFYDEKKLKLFLQAVVNVSANGCSDPAYLCVSSLSVKESNDNLADFLKNRLINLILPNNTD